MTDDPAFTAAVDAMRRAPGMHDTLGVPTAVRLAGPSRITPSSAKLMLDVEGPEGTRRIHAFRDTRDGDWRFEHANVVNGV